MTESRIWLRLEKIAKVAGREALTMALTLWYCMTDARTPGHVKALMLGDLIYLISPIDAIPDFLPLVGYSDDIGLMAATIAALATHIRKEHREQALAKTDEWLNRV
ncbi:MAG TPA: YkvA family protein [Bdellovibrionales bacterium]|nr:YkvA family protein [Bdellovibrionales bacterium]